MSDPIPFPGDIGRVIRLNCKGAVSDPESTEAAFRVGDICSFPPTGYRFRIVRVDGDDVYFERVS